MEQRDFGLEIERKLKSVEKKEFLNTSENLIS